MGHRYEVAKGDKLATQLLARANVMLARFKVDNTAQTVNVIGQNV